MTDSRDTDGVDRSTVAEEHAAHLERSRAVWNRWSDNYTLSERDFEPMREVAIDHLGLQQGDRVLEIGCGPGVNFERVRGDIGPMGELVAVDYSPDMASNARDRIANRGWENVTVRVDDAATADLDGSFDAALATLSLSIMPDVRKAAETVADVLAPGSRFVVFDLRAIPEGPARVVNPFLRGFLRWFANWNADETVLDALEAVFDRCEVVESYGFGAAYTAVCRTCPDR